MNNNHTIDRNRQQQQQQQGRQNDRFQGQPNQGKPPQERQQQQAVRDNRLDSIVVGQWQISRRSLLTICKSIHVLSLVVITINSSIVIGATIIGCLSIVNAATGGGWHEGIVGGLLLCASIVVGALGNRVHRWLAGLVSRRHGL